MDQRVIEEIARNVASAVRGVTQEQVKRVIEEKMKNPALGCRAIGKIVGLKKDKVNEVWKKCESVIASAKTEEPGKIEDEGKFYARAFSLIEELHKNDLTPRQAVIELVKRLKITPDKAEEVVKKYHGIDDLTAIKELENRIESIGSTLRSFQAEIRTEVQILRERMVLALQHARDKMWGCPYYRALNGTCRRWVWKTKPKDMVWIWNDIVEEGNEWSLRVKKHPEFCATCSVPLTQKSQTPVLPSLSYSPSTSSFWRRSRL